MGANPESRTDSGTSVWIPGSLASRAPRNDRGARLWNLQTRLVDDLFEHGYLALDAFAESVRPFGDHRQADLGELFLHVGLGQDGGEFLGEAIDDRLRRAGQHVDA